MKIEAAVAHEIMADNVDWETGRQPDELAAVKDDNVNWETGWKPDELAAVEGYCEMLRDNPRAKTPGVDGSTADRQHVKAAKLEARFNAAAVSSSRARCVHRSFVERDGLLDARAPKKKKTPPCRRVAA